MAKRRKRKDSDSKLKARVSLDQKNKSKTTAYSATHKILVVGDGNFSFSRGLVASLSSGTNVTATSYDTYDEVVKKYGPEAQACITACQEAGAEVLHSVDASKLQDHFGAASFQRIVFNFPHTGQQRVHINRAMVSGFFSSARPLLTRGGELHVTLKLQPPYSSWGIPELALEQGYVNYSTRDFDLAAFPGYTHKTTEKDAVELDTGSGDAKRAIKTLVFRRIAGQPADGASKPSDSAGSDAAQVQLDAQVAAQDKAGEDGLAPAQQGREPVPDERKAEETATQVSQDVKPQTPKKKRARSTQPSPGQAADGARPEAPQAEPSPAVPHVAPQPVQDDAPTEEQGAGLPDPQNSKGGPAKQANTAPAEAPQKGQQPRVSNTKANRNRARGARHSWFEIRDQHVQKQLPVTKQAKSAFLEYVSSQWDLQVQNNDPRPWEFGATRSAPADKAGEKSGGDHTAEGKMRRKSRKHDSRGCSEVLGNGENGA